jgi:photosystem II stability/assembly factor-like uncharacterized protein
VSRNIVTSSDLYDIDCMMNDVIFVCGENGAIFKTTNGGNNWIQQFSGVSANLKSIEMVTSILGFACGEGGVVIKTFDGGASWYQLNSGTTSLDFNSIHTIDIRRRESHRN